MSRRLIITDVMTDEEIDAQLEFENKVAKIQSVQEMADRCDELNKLLDKVPTKNEIQRRRDEYVAEIEDMKIVED